MRVPQSVALRMSCRVYGFSALDGHAVMPLVAGIGRHAHLGGVLAHRSPPPGLACLCGLSDPLERALMRRAPGVLQRGRQSAPRLHPATADKPGPAGPETCGSRWGCGKVGVVEVARHVADLLVDWVFSSPRFQLSARLWRSGRSVRGSRACARGRAGRHPTPRAPRPSGHRCPGRVVVHFVFLELE